MATVEEIQQAGPFTLHNLMGSNGVVATWSGEGTNGNPYVIVCMARTDLKQPELWDKCEQAAQAVQSGVPAGVLAPEMYGQEKGIYFMAYPFLEGTHLGKNINERGLPPAINSVSIMIQVLEILEGLQKIGLTHRVLTPASIFLSPDGRVRLLHCGWTHMLLGAENGPANENMMSNLPFIAPEVLDYQPSELPADIYSIGANLYFLLTGQPTHWEDDPNSLIQKIQGGNIDFGPLNQAVGEDLTEIIEEMLEVDPEDRPPNIEALINRIQMASQNLPALESENAFVSSDANQAPPDEGYDTRPAGSPPPIPDAPSDQQYHDQATQEAVAPSSGRPAPPPPKPAEQPNIYEDQDVKDPRFATQDEMLNQDANEPNYFNDSNEDQRGDVYENLYGEGDAPDPTDPYAGAGESNDSYEAPMSADGYRSQNKRSERQAGLAKAQQLAAEAQEQNRLEHERQQAIEEEKARLRQEKKKKAVKLMILGGIIFVGLIAIGGVAFYVSSLSDGSDEDSAAIAQAAEEQKRRMEELRKEREAREKLVNDTKETLTTIGQIATKYHQTFGTWPLSVDEMKEVTDEEINMTDSWGTDMEVRPMGFIMSAGPDKEWQTDDDMWIDSENNEIVSNSEL